MDELITALTETGYSFAHFGWSKAPDGDYGVYAEDDQLALYADNKPVEKVLQGTIDYFTRDDSGKPMSVIEGKLEKYNVPYRMESIQFEPDTGYIHYEWVFEVLFVYTEPTPTPNEVTPNGEN